MKTINMKREEAIESKLESISRYLGELGTRTNAHLKNQKMLYDTLLQTRTYPLTIEMNNALEDSAINETEVEELLQEEEGSWFHQDEIDPGQ